MNSVIKQIVLAAGILIAPLAVAQGKPGKEQKTPEERAKRHTERMTQELGLTAEQSAKVGDINLRYVDVLADLKASGQDKEVMKEQGKALRDKRDEELKLVLTAEQYSKMMTLREQKRKEAKAKRAASGSQEVPTHNE
ncbi:MAG: hypothetical protein JNL05_00270 [Flavobacteriales bacterium]|nr:hypothetical protein [Flavobacteriales bacterium]